MAGLRGGFQPGFQPVFWRGLVRIRCWYIAYSLTGRTATEDTVDPESGGVMAVAGVEIDFDTAYNIVSGLGQWQAKPTEWGDHWHYPTGCEGPWCGDNAVAVQADAQYDLWCIVCERATACGAGGLRVPVLRHVGHGVADAARRRDGGGGVCEVRCAVSAGRHWRASNQRTARSGRRWRAGGQHNDVGRRGRWCGRWRRAAAKGRL